MLLFIGSQNIIIILKFSCVKFLTGTRLARDFGSENTYIQKSREWPMCNKVSRKEWKYFIKNDVD